MPDMKYLMLFEAFGSNTLSKMMNFLSKKVDRDSAEAFKDKLKRLINQFDIPIDKISDKDVKYLNKNQALKLRNMDRVQNGKGIYCLKFWFSIDEGYLGFTGTGNNSMDFKSYLKYNKRNRDRDRGQNTPFDDSELNYIKNTLNIKTGKLTPVKDYNDLTHKQLVIGIFSDDEDDKSRIGLAKMWVSEHGDLHAIQNVAGGGEPDDRIDGESWRDLREGDEPENEDGYVPFSRSWSMGSVNSPGSDHAKLHIYTPSEEPLHVEGVKREEKKEDEEKESPYDFNLPLNSSYNLREWGDTGWSISDHNSVEKSDFSIILMLDDVLKSVGTKVSDVRKNREESKEGAIRLLSDSEIKKANIERYIAALVGKMGIKQDITELKNLQRLVIKSICSDFAFISIYKARPGFDTLDNIVHNIYELMSCVESEKKYYLSNIVSGFKSLNLYSDDYIKQYKMSLNIINNSNSEAIKEIFNIFMEISKKIKNYLLSQNIETIEDLSMVVAKLKSIRTLANERGLSLGYTRNILNEFHYPNDTEYYVDRIDERKEKDILEDIKKAKHIERYVESLLR